MQAIFVRPNWQAIAHNVQQQRRRMLWVLLLSMLAILILVGTVQRTISRLALQAILADGGAWGIAWAVSVCYALRHRSECWRIGAITGLLVALIFTAVSVVPKWNVDTWMTESYKSHPILYWGVWHCLILGVVRWLTHRYPREMRARPKPGTMAAQFSHRDIGGRSTGRTLFILHRLYWSRATPLSPAAPLFLATEF